MSDAAIPFVDLVTPHLQLEEELTGTFRKALRSAGFIGGVEVEAFEREFADYCGTAHCVGVANGTDALRFALMAAGVRRGDAVITVSHTFIATVEAISHAGAGTEFVDIYDRTYCMSPTSLSAYLCGCAKDPTTGRFLGQRTGMPLAAVVPVHLYGQVADMDAIRDVANRFGLIVVEDACQAHGAEYRSADRGWQRAGGLGHAAGFSFYPGKNLGACGDAGAVTTNNADIARTIRMLRDHGQSKKYVHDIEGTNGRLDAIQAAVLRIKLRHLDDWNALRRAAADRYKDLLAEADLVLPYEPPDSRSVYHLYVVRTEQRDLLDDRMRTAGIACGFHYPLPVHLQHCYRDWGYLRGTLPVTERVADTVLSLPLFPGLTAPQQQRVAAVACSFPVVSRPEDAPAPDTPHASA
jgi:dTDP-4-amino-4,6-dideoxygalactose transaminase